MTGINISKPIIVIIVALDEELKPLINFFNAELKSEKKIAFWLSNDYGQKIIIYKLHKMGNNASASATTKIISKFPSIKYVIFSGIAGGNPKFVNIGDVVISDSSGIIQYDFGKKGDNFEIRASPIPPNSVLLNFAQNYIHYFESEKLEEFNKFIQNELLHTRLIGDLLSTNPLKAIIGTIGSANMVLKNEIMREKLFNSHKIIAVEMEGSGIAEATWECEVGYLIIRSICDFCDSGKNDDYHQLAAYSAGFFTKIFIDFYSSSLISSQKEEKIINEKISTENIQNEFNKVVYFIQNLLSNQYNSNYFIKNSPYLSDMKYIRIRHRKHSQEIDLFFKDYDYLLQLQLYVDTVNYSIAKIGRESNNLDDPKVCNKFLEEIRNSLNTRYGTQIFYIKDYDHIDLFLNSEIKCAGGAIGGIFVKKIDGFASNYLEINLIINNLGNISNEITKVEFNIPKKRVKSIENLNLIIEGNSNEIISRKFSDLPNFDDRIIKTPNLKMICIVYFRSGRKFITNSIQIPSFDKFEII